MLNVFFLQGLLYSGLLEELVDVLEMKGDHLMEIKVFKCDHNGTLKSVI